MEKFKKLNREQMKAITAGEVQAYYADCQCDNGQSFQFYYDDIDNCGDGVPMSGDVWDPYYDGCGGAFSCGELQCGFVGA